MSNENIKAIFARNGLFSPRNEVSAEVLSAYRGKVPDFLLELWQSEGVGVWGGGLFQLCIPSQFDGLLSQIFHADKDFSHQDCYVIGYGAFGDLMVWSERHWMTDIYLNRGEVICRGLLSPDKKRDAEATIATALFSITKNQTLMGYDEEHKPLLARARKKLGDLESDQAYGFFPALAMGGAPTLDNIKVTPALEYFLFLAQLQQFKLVDYLARPPSVVRAIG